MFYAGYSSNILKLLRPTRAVTINMGMHMPAWYDLFGLTPDSKEDVDGIEESAKILHSMIDAVSAFIVHFRFIL